MATEITAQEFENEVLKSDLPVMVDFYAPWCMPCKMIAPLVEDLSNELSGKAKFVKVDIDHASDIVTRFNIRGVPTLMFFKDGQAIDSIVGAVPKEAIVEKLNTII